MTRTMWIAVFCLVTSGASIAIRVVSPSASLFAETTPHQSRIETGPIPNEAAKSDRLELPSIRADTETMPAAPAVPVENPSGKPETIQDTPPALAGCQRQDRSVRAASSPSCRQRAKERQQ